MTPTTTRTISSETSTTGRFSDVVLPKPKVIFHLQVETHFFTERKFRSGQVEQHDLGIVPGRDLQFFLFADGRPVARGNGLAVECRLPTEHLQPGMAAGFRCVDDCL